MMTTKKEQTHTLLPAEKYCLTVSEAAAYFEIGPKKIRQIASEHLEDGIFVKHGAKLLILRIPFEEFLQKTPIL